MVVPAFGVRVFSAPLFGPGFMGSFDLQFWTRIGTMNRPFARKRLGLRQPTGAFDRVPAPESARGLAHSKTLRCVGRFMESSDLQLMTRGWRCWIRRAPGPFRSVVGVRVSCHCAPARQTGNG